MNKLIKRVQGWLDWRGITTQDIIVATICMGALLTMLTILIIAALS
jgi:hypothetical protein